LSMAGLFVLRDGEPVLEEPDARADEHAFEFGGLAHEFEVFVGAAEAHHPFHPGAVVPGAVVEHHFTGGRQVGDVALEEPFALFLVGGFGERHHAGVARVEVFHVALDRAALAGGVAAFEEDDEFLPGLLCPDLHLEQFGLKLELHRLVGAGGERGEVVGGAAAGRGGERVVGHGGLLGRCPSVTVS